MTTHNCTHCGKKVSGPCRRCNRGIGLALKDMFMRLNKSQAKLLEDAYNHEIRWSINFIYVSLIRGYYNYVLRYDRETGKIDTIKPK